MTRANIPFLQRIVSRGKVFWYYRRKAFPRVRLPEPTDPDFSAAYVKAGGAPESVRRAQRGTLAALVNAYLASPEFKEKATTTQAEYRRVMLAIANAYGEGEVAALERVHVRAIRDAKAETPAAANTTLRALSVLLSYAVELGWRPDNPAMRMKKLKVGNWRAWTPQELDAFRGRWPTGTMQRAAFSLAYHTTQRRADLVTMTQADRDGGRIAVVQQKTGKRLSIRELPALTRDLDAVPRHMALLTGKRGAAFDPVYFGAWFADAIGEAELPDDCVLHGLRKSGVVALAEAGCTVAEIQAVSGQSAAMVEHYWRDANKAGLADAAVVKLEEHATRTRSVKPGDQGVKR